MAGMLASCSIGRQTNTATESAKGSTYSHTLSLHGNPGRARLERGKELLGQGDFDGAIALLAVAADDQEAAPEIRAEALFELGRAHADLLNPQKDPEKAMAAWERLQEEYPDSPFAAKAGERMKELQPAGN
jgi:tetratricopeptide (TPR) repeat protein